MIADHFTANDWVAVIAAVFGGLATTIAAVFAGLAAMRAGQAKVVATEVRDAVQTMNALSIGQMADAAESRRIVEIPPVERTVQEAIHLAAIPEPPE